MGCWGMEMDGSIIAASPNPRGLRDAARGNVRWRTRRCSAAFRHDEIVSSVPNLSSAWNEKAQIVGVGLFYLNVRKATRLEAAVQA
jgi:hypothetical protein